MVEHYVSNAFDVFVPRYGYDRQRRALMTLSVNGDKPLDPAIKKELGVVIYQFGFVPVACKNIEVSFLQKEVLDSAQHHRRIAIAHLRHKNSERVAATCAQ